MPDKPPKNRKALWSMWLGIFGWVILIVETVWILLPIPISMPASIAVFRATFIPFVYTGMPIAAIVLGHLALGKIRVTQEGGRNEARVGLAFGYFSVAILVIRQLVAYSYIGFVLVQYYTR